MEIVVSPLYYSRTFYKDYRWIYTNKNLCAETIKILNSEYNNFDKDKMAFLENKHIYIRKHIGKGISFYVFKKENSTDIGGRNIYSLSGYTFSFDTSKSFSMELLSLLSAYFLENSISLDRSKINDSNGVLELRNVVNFMPILDSFDSDVRLEIDRFLIEKGSRNGIIVRKNGESKYKVSHL